MPFESASAPGREWLKIWPSGTGVASSTADNSGSVITDPYTFFRAGSNALLRDVNRGGRLLHLPKHEDGTPRTAVEIMPLWAVNTGTATIQRWLLHRGHKHGLPADQTQVDGAFTVIPTVDDLGVGFIVNVDRTVGLGVAAAAQTLALALPATRETALMRLAPGSTSAPLFQFDLADTQYFYGTTFQCAMLDAEWFAVTVSAVANGPLAILGRVAVMP